MQFLWLFLILLSACSTQTKYLPPIEKSFPSQFDLNEAEMNQVWAYKERQAQKGIKPCQNYKELSEEEDYPLQSLAFVQSLEQCKYSKDELLNIWENKKVPTWLYPSYARISLKLAKKFKIKKYKAYFTYLISLNEKNPDDREYLLQKSLKYIKKSEEKDLYTKIENELFKRAPRFIKKINNKNIYKVARSFEKNRNFSRARKLYRKIINSNDQPYELKIKAWNRTRLSYKVQRKRDVYLEKTASMLRYYRRHIKKNPDNDFLINSYHKTRIKYARGLWTQDQKSKALKELRDILKDPNLSIDNIARVNWLIGNINFENKNYKTANDYFKKTIENEIEDKDFQDTLYWTLGWNYYIQKKYKDALEIFQESLKASDDIFFKQKLMFWLASAHEKLGNHEDAKELWTTIIEDFNYSYYSAVSYKKLGIPIKPIRNDTHLKIKKDVILEWLLYTENNELAQIYLEKNLRRSKDIINNIKLYSKAELHDRAIFEFVRFDPEEREEHLFDVINEIFPQPHKKIIGKSTKKFNIERELAYSIARQESAMNQYARSPADAFGLMQIIPEKAKQVSKKFKIPYKKYNDLYSPKTNTAIGSALLKDLKAKFNGKFPLYVASYNAGSSPVKRWVKTRFNGDMLELIESVPYKETRKYIKLVTRNFILYLRLNKKQSFKFDDVLKF